MDGEILTPRTQVASVPYGIRAGSANFAMECSFSLQSQNALHSEMSEFAVNAGFADNAFHATWADSSAWSATSAPDADWIIDQENIYHVGGRVGIGTTQPAADLDVVCDRIRLGDSSGTRSKEMLLRVDGAAVDLDVNGCDLFLKSNTGNTMIQPFGGNVGIGTTTPSRLLHVYSSSNPRILVEAPADQAPELNLQRGTTTHALYINDGDDLVFHRAGDRVTFTDDGNVGIGTTAPTSKLQVTGMVYSTTGGYKFPDGSILTSATGASGWSLTGNSGTTPTPISWARRTHPL